MIADIKPSKVVFFLGAGASVAAGVPDTYSFVDKFIENIKDNGKKETIKKIIEKLKSWKKSDIDIELLLETLTKLENKEQEPLLRFYEGGNFILKEAFVKPLIKDLKDFIKSKAIVLEEKVQYLQPLLAFIHEFRPLDVVSLNYDTCIEQFCNIHKLIYQDGFDVYWNPKVFGAEHIDIRLYKLHGSVIWYQSDRGDYIKLPVMTDESKVQLITGEKAENLMLYPMQKWDYAEPLLELLVYIKQLLESETCEFLIVIGYSFRDDHIRRILWDAARKNKKLCVMFIDPNAHKIYSEKLKYYDNEHSNLSSLDGRVICLPYKFEKVFLHLRHYYLKKLQDALLNEEKQHKAEITGETTNWMSSLNLFVEAEHFEKVESLLSKNEELKYKLESDWQHNLGRLLRGTLNFSIRGKEKANTYFNDFNNFLHNMLIERMHVVVNQKYIDVHFNYHRDNTVTGDLDEKCSHCVCAKGFDERIEDLNKICEMRKNFGCCNEGLFLKIVEKLKELKDYLKPFVSGSISGSDYADLRNNKKLFVYDQFLNNYKKFQKEAYSPELHKELKSMVEKVETGILEEIVEKN